MGSAMPSTIMVDPSPVPRPKRASGRPLAQQCLHGGVVDDFHGAIECRTKIEPDPPASQVIWFRNRPAAENRVGIADRRHITHPIPGELLHLANHSPRGERWPG